MPLADPGEFRDNSASACVRVNVGGDHVSEDLDEPCIIRDLGGWPSGGLSHMKLRRPVGEALSVQGGVIAPVRRRSRRGRDFSIGMGEAAPI